MIERREEADQFRDETHHIDGLSVSLANKLCPPCERRMRENRERERERELSGESDSRR